MNDFASLCHALAIPALRSRISSAALRARFTGSNHADLAYDCIADLFTLDDEGGLLQIKTYFESIDVAHASDEQLLAHLRRLVFSKVNQGIFRIYNEADPSLGKILRNIKLSLQALHNFTYAERFGEACIFPTMCDTLEHLPPPGLADLERMLRKAANGSEHIPGLLAKLSRCLRQQEELSRIVPLLSVAIIFRSIYSAPDELSRAEMPVDEQFLSADALATIHEACLREKTEAASRYVPKEKSIAGSWTISSW